MSHNVTIRTLDEAVRRIVVDNDPESIAYLQDKISDAFIGVAMPMGSHLTLGNPDHPDNVAIEAKLHGRHWTVLSPADINRIQDAPVLLTDVALHYYLPAFLRDSLTDIAGTNLTIFLEPILTGFNPVDRTAEADFTRFSRFSTKQRRVVAAWLRVQAGVDEDDRDACLNAIDSFWGVE